MTSPTALRFHRPNAVGVAGNGHGNSMTPTTPTGVVGPIANGTFSVAVAGVAAFAAAGVATVSASE